MVLGYLLPSIDLAKTHTPHKLFQSLADVVRFLHRLESLLELLPELVDELAGKEVGKELAEAVLAGGSSASDYVQHHRSHPFESEFVRGFFGLENS